jgi:hypothetical protein
MKPKWLVGLGICIAVASMLLGCSTGSNIVPVTGNESMAVPDTISLARDRSATYIQSKYALPGLPASANLNWNVSIYHNPDQSDLTLYTFTSGDWIVTIREPSSTVGKTSVTYANTATDFVWHGFIDGNGNVSVSQFQR